MTCNASYYEDNSDSCELWVPGSPLFPIREVADGIGHSQTQADRNEFKAALGTITATKLHR